MRALRVLKALVTLELRPLDENLAERFVRAFFYIEELER